LKATKKAIAAGANHIIVAGGDGTLRGCVQAVFEEEATVSLGLVPIGTGNILARNLKLPINNLEKCIKRSVSGDTYEIDLGVAKAINQHGELTKFYFTGIAGIGMDARIMQRTLPELKRRVGWIAYLEGGLRSLPMKFEKFEVMVDDLSPRTLKSYSILIGNAGWLPGQISMMPDARLDDGKLDVAAIGPRKIWNWVDFFARVTWQNKVVRPLALGRKWMDLTANLKTIENLGGSRIRVKPHHLSPLQLDGDVIGEVLEVDFSLKHKVLRIRL
jgi:diacylglycerol kinase family enzyme